MFNWFLPTRARAPSYRTALLMLAASVLSCVTLISAHAAPASDNSKETLITAQQMTSDQEKGVVTAVGKVEIAHGGYIMHADRLIYNQTTNVMRAEGHVVTLAPSGEVMFSEKQEITGDMKQAFAENMSILFPDNSRLAARSLQRFDEQWILMRKGMYTACNVCKENPDKAPLWQVRANTITQDNVSHNIYYHDATVDFFGMPVMYFPYISTPDPTVKRRQGFLSPTPGTSPDLGTFIRTPYYFDIAPNIDATLAPTFSRKDTLQLGGQFRERLHNGSMQFDGSLTHAELISDAGVNEGYNWRGHLYGKILYNIDNVWRAGSDIAFSSDKSYLQRYRISSADELVNRAYVEGFKGRNYGVVNGYYYEDLRPGTRAVEPLVLPQANFHLLGEPTKTLGGRWSLSGGMLVTTRDNKNQGINQQGPDTRRISLNTGWERRLISDTGLATVVSGLVRSDNYSADNVIKTNSDGSTTTFNEVLLSRAFAQGTVTTSYPMGRRGKNFEQILEPIVSVTAAPNIRTNDRQPIEDSLDVEYDETSLFSPNRFTGNDLIEGGSRITYGMRQALNFDDGMHMETFGGSSYRFERNPNFPDQSGLQRRGADYVWRINLEPVKWFNLNYGTRLDRNTLKAQRQDASLSIGVPEFRVNSRYISAYQTETTGTTDLVKDLSVGFSSKFTKYWTVSGTHVQAFEPQPGPRSTNMSLNYNDECFIIGVTASRDHTTRADLSSGTSVVFHFYLRNFGGVQTDSSSQGNFPKEFRQE